MNQPLPAAPVQQARSKTRKVRRDLQVVGGEIELSTTILESELPESQKRGDVGKALRQNGAAAEKVVQAKEELEQVETLLEKEIEERKRLEDELKKR